MEDERKWCVYCHTNKINGKKYIGITSLKPERRWGNNGNKYKEQIFYRSIEKYGWENFTHKILYNSLTEKEASLKEKNMIKKYKTNIPMYGYNISLGGLNFVDNNLGKNGRSKRVVCDGEMFNCIKEVGLKYNFKESTTRAMLNGNSRMDKKLYNKGLRYADETIEERNKRIKMSTKRVSPTKVTCEDTIYDTITDCANHYNINRTTMTAWLNGNSNMPLNFYMMGLSYLENTNNRYGNISPFEYKSNCDRIKKVIIDEKVFNSIVELKLYFGTKAEIGRYLNGRKPMPQKYLDRGLRYYNPETDKDLPIYQNND